MMKLLQQSKSKKFDNKRRKDEFLSQLRGEDYDYEGFMDEENATRQAMRDSVQSQREWHMRQEFRQRTGGFSNTYEEGRSSHGSVSDYFDKKIKKSIPTDSEFSLRGAIPELVRSKSAKQPKVNDSFLKTLRKKLGESVSKFFIYD